jgi:tetratricopeptide (TPR) repeat protein
MRRITCQVTLSIVVLLFGSVFAAAQFPSSIDGFVWDEARRPVYNAYVELTNSMGTTIARERTSSTGRFTFRGMPEGRYSVTVKPFGTNLLEQSQDVELIRLFGRTTPINMEFRLKVDKRFVSKRPTITGTVFVQEVPEAAKRLFTSGMNAFDVDKDDKAILDLEKAIEAFPTYFDALAILGKKHVLEGRYEKGYPYLLKAIDVNRKCPDCYFTLGLAFHKLDQAPAALQAAASAVLLSGQTPEYRLLLGTLLRTQGDYVRAEKTLLMAKSLYKEPNPEVFWELSLLYNKTNRNAEAADALEAFLKAKPDADGKEKQRVKDLIAKLRKAK